MYVCMCVSTSIYTDKYLWYIIYAKLHFQGFCTNNYQLGTILFPTGHFANVKTFVFVTMEGVGCYWYLQSRYRDAAKHAIMYRTVSTTKRYLAKMVLMSRSKHPALHVSLQITATTAYPPMFLQVPTIILVWQ